MNFVEIALQSLKPKLNKSADAQFRSVEKELEKLIRDYSTNDSSKVITVAVVDKADAILLSKRLSLDYVEYSENGLKESLQIKVIKKAGRPKNIVHISWLNKNMSPRQFKKFSMEEFKKTHVLKSQIIKSKLITNAQLKKYLAEGVLKTVISGNKTYLKRESVFNLLK